MIPTTAASATTAPATAPAMAPPLTGVMLAGGEVVAGVVKIGDEVGNDDARGLVAGTLEEVEEVTEPACPKGVTSGVVVVRTVLLYPFAAAQPYP